MKVRIREIHEAEVDIGDITEAEFDALTEEERTEILNDAAIEADRSQSWYNVNISKIEVVK